LFSSKVNLFYVLGFLNSALVRFILGQLNPTVNFQIGDLRRVPFLHPPASLESEVADLAYGAVLLAKEAETCDPDSPRYKHSAESCRGMLEQLDSAEAEIQQKIDRCIFDLYAIADRTRNEILDDAWVAN